MESHKKRKKNMPEKKYLSRNDIRRLKKASESSEDRLVIGELARTGLSVNELKKTKGIVHCPYL